MMSVSESESVKAPRTRRQRRDPVPVGALEVSPVAEVEKLPPSDLEAQRFLTMLEVHVRSGNWAQAHVTLNACEREVRVRSLALDGVGGEEESGVPRAKRDRLVADMAIEPQMAEALARAGFETAGQVADAWIGRLAQVDRIGAGSLKRIGLALWDWQLIDGEQYSVLFPFLEQLKKQGGERYGLGKIKNAG